MRRAADAAERLVVVHPQRAEERDRAERPVREAVRRADERDVAQPGVVELVADADERPPRLDRLADQLRAAPPLLERLEQALAGLELVGARLAEEARGAADVEPLLLLGDEIRERRPHGLDERPLARREARVARAAAGACASRAARPARPSLRYSRAQSTRPGIDRLGERDHPLRHPAGRRDHDDEDDRRLQQQHLDVVDARGLERRRRDEREQAASPRDSISVVCCSARLDLAAQRREVERERAGPRLDAARAARRRRAGSRARSARVPRTCAGA